MALDAAKLDEVNAMIERVRAAGLPDEADVFSNSYWGWIRMNEAYKYAHPYVANPEPGTGMTPISALTVVDYTHRHWSELIPGSPKLDDKAVLREAEADEAWHRQEDLRMRRAAGDDI